MILRIGINSLLLLILSTGALFPSFGHAQTMEDARDELAAFNWDAAYKHFAALAKTAKPQSETWAQATFGAAAAVSNRQPASQDFADQAAKLYQSIVDTTPQSKFTARSLMKLARLKELRDYPGDKPDLDGAVELYLKVAATWPDESIASEATLRAAAARVQAYDAPDFANVSAGISLLEKWVAEHPKDPYLSIMYQYLGDTYFLPLSTSARIAGDTEKMKQYYAKSLACYDKVNSIGWTDAGNQGPILWRCAVMSEAIGNTPSAIKYYTLIINQTPTSGKAYESQLALRRLGAPAPEIDLIHKSSVQPATRPAGQEVSR